MKLKTRLTVLQILGLILGIGLALLFQTILVRQYVSQVLVGQQFSVASHVAGQFDDELRTRLEWVELIVKRITPEVMATRESLTQYLKDRQIAAKYFHGGIFVTDADGTCLADYPSVGGRIGTNYAERDYVQIALREKRSVVGRPVQGKTLKQPIISIATPILNTDGSVVGAFVGVITYDQLSFLGSSQARSRDELPARLIVYSPKDDMTVFSDHPGEALKSVSVADIDPVVSVPLLAGREGKFVGTAKDGQEITAAIKTIPSSGWMLALITPMHKINQGIDAINLKIYGIALLLSLLLSWLLWRVLARMLAGLGEAAQAISLMMQGKQKMHALPYRADDEVGELVASFNALQERVANSEETLRKLTGELEIRVQEELTKNREKDHLLIQQSRLAAMGEMVHNIAHQWRQPITALTLLLANIQDAYEFNELTRESLDSDVKTGQRLIQGMSTTIDDFRNFFMPNKEKEFFLADDAVDDAIKLALDSFAAHDIKIVREKNIEPCIVLGYPNEFAQVVLNLLTNAKEAITGKNIAGEIHARVEKDENAIIVSIRDNGGGIPEKILPKVFDPYFTTKESGSGIGLYMSKMIMDNMGGDIAIRNVEGGTEMLLTLPLAAPAV